ncbi:Ectoine hydroxylase-related dioxygenase, phytanoyl-CoA dioxygenase (PhyH) family [Sphingobium sp. AP50]|uniref:phytanoyl-CoA dioxygenase family protein n=1 Tax=Sphingobium sp. AP50 TaxID=1884369 RepID=UPI0008BF8AC5|nr:phytanoyl-CoA dioxygenase family protein [Sphingobium sp. AP50]SEJ92038.1 Ectoine hydroxylase-related dioxygenase, phytanoyl-CoA dioxygenase (PhyH) family [Sphingobium sp. AP50]
MKQQHIGHAVAPHLDALESHGFCLVENIIPTAMVEGLASDLGDSFAATPVSQGPFYGADTVRFGGLLNRSPFAALFIQHPLILEIVGNILGAWCDTIQLNLTQAIEIRPGAEQQVPHRDQDMWPVSRMLPSDHAAEYLVNVMWPFTPYRPENGSTILWPGSHRRQAEDLIDAEEAVSLEIMPGSALLFLGSTLHCGGANRTMAARRGMIVSYSLGWLKPYEIQTLVYPPEIAKSLSPDLARLIGYQVHRPNLGNVEGRCPSVLLGDELAAGAIDALAPEQIALIEAFHAQLQATNSQVSL